MIKESKSLSKTCKHPTCGPICRREKKKPVRRKPIRKVSIKLLQKRAKEKKDRNGKPTELQQWYSEIMAREKPVCWETGSYINAESFHSSVAHILPKNIFTSVKAHPLNYLILISWGGIHDKSHRWDTFQKMKVWPLAVERFKQIYPAIDPKERRLIPECLMRHIKV